MGGGKSASTGFVWAMHWLRRVALCRQLRGVEHTCLTGFRGWPSLGQPTGGETSMTKTAKCLAACCAIIYLLVTYAWADLAAGVAAYNRGDYSTALKEFRPLADQGDAEAQTYLGGMYADGTGVPQDYKEAIRWYRLAAEQGGPHAQFNLGGMHDNGTGVPQD